MGLLITLHENAGMVDTRAAEKAFPSTVTLYIPSDKGGGSIEPLGSEVLIRRTKTISYSQPGIASSKTEKKFYRESLTAVHSKIYREWKRSSLV